MNAAYFIARRISRSHSSDFSHTAHRFATASVAVGLAASLVAVLILRGFQYTVEEKIHRFSGHFIISKLTTSNAVEGLPFSFNMDFYKHPTRSIYGGVERVEEVVYKTGLIRTHGEALGVIFKGVGPHFGGTDFREYLVEGRLPNFPDSGYSREMVMSRTMADKLDAYLGEDFVVYFFQDPPRFRKLRVVGIYEANISEYFDSKVIFCDIGLIQRLNGWADSTASSLEVYLANPRYVDASYEAIDRQLPYDLYVESAQQKYADIFQWLGLIGRQVNILLAVIFIVICINLVAIILILVVERTRMVGVLQSMGASRGFIRAIFFYSGLRLVLRGVFWGNIVGLAFCFAQDQFHLISLNPQDYYMRFVPIHWDWLSVLAVNLLVSTVTALTLLVPTVMAGRKDPVQAIRFA